MAQYFDFKDEAQVQALAATAQRHREEALEERGGLGEADDDVLGDLGDLYSGVPTKPLLDKYKDEQADASSFRGDPGRWSRRANDPEHTEFTQIGTHYLDDAEQQRATVTARDGRLVGGDGQPLDTTAASGIGTYNAEGQGKHIFAMTPDQTVRALDPWAAHREVPLPTAPAPDAKQNARLETVNHSSLVGGGRVAMAGELTAAHGQLQQISDQSGHYEPDNPMLYTAVQHFEGQGVDMSNVGVKMVGKQTGQKPLIASATEFSGYGGAIDAEEQMRERREDFADELEDEVDERASHAPFADPRAGRGYFPVGRVVEPQAKRAVPAFDERSEGQGRTAALRHVFAHYAD